jgi:hypothetical protein
MFKAVVGQGGRPLPDGPRGRRKRMATSPHGWRGGRRGRPPVAAANHHRTASPSTQRTAEKADIREQGCLCVCPSVSSVRPSVTSDKVRVHPIRVNVLLTLDRINLDLLCPRWLPHRCHIGWSGLLWAHTVG